MDFGATEGQSVFRSSDGGVTWVVVPGIQAADWAVRSIALDPLPPATLYAGTATGKVFSRPTIGVLPFSAFGSLPANPVSGLVVKPGSPSRIYAALDGAGVQTTTSAAASWAPMNAGLTWLNATALGFDPDGNGTLYVTTIGGGVFQFEFSPDPSPPLVFIDTPVPPTFSTTTAPVTVSGSAVGPGVFRVFWLTNRGRAGIASGTTSWTAAVPLEPGPSIITVTAVNGSFSHGSQTIEVIWLHDPNISASPPSLAFGSIPVGTVLVHPVTISNPGTADLVIGQVSIGGAAPGQFAIKVAKDFCSGKTLLPATSCVVKVKFKPTEAGPHADTLLIPSNDPDTAVLSVGLGGTGAGPEISVSPLSVPFGTTTLGSLPVIQTVTVTNVGNADLTLGAAGIGGVNANDFKIKALKDFCSGQTLTATSSCTIKVKFKSTSLGAKTGELTIPSNDFSESLVSVSLSGTVQ